MTQQDEAQDYESDKIDFTRVRFEILDFLQPGVGGPSARGYNLSNVNIVYHTSTVESQSHT